MIFIDVVSNDNKPVEVYSDCQSNNSTRGASSSEYDTKTHRAHCSRVWYAAAQRAPLSL